MTILETIGHIALVVREPARTASLFEALFDAKPVRSADGEGHQETCVRLGGTWFVLVEAEVERPVTGDHVAFRVSPDALRLVAGKLARMGHDYQLARSDTALYFADFDNHVFELDSVGMDPQSHG